MDAATKRSHPTVCPSNEARPCLVHEVTEQGTLVGVRGSFRLECPKHRQAPYESTNRGLTLPVRGMPVSPLSRPAVFERVTGMLGERRYQTNRNDNEPLITQNDPK